MAEQSENKSVYRRGAEDGSVFGVFLIVLFFVSIYSMNNALLSLLSLIMMVSVPFIIYRFIGRARRENPNFRFFSAYWMHGITIFLCGSLIQALVVYVFFRFIDPTFIANMFASCSASLKEIGSGDARQMASLLDKMICEGMIPSPMSMATSTIWSVTFSGSILSMIIALIYKIKDRREPLTPDANNEQQA